MAPTYQEFLDWWELNGQPPLRTELDMAGIADVMQAAVLALWQEDNRAPYDLYFFGERVVEVVAGNYAPTVRKGQVVDATLAQQVRAAVAPVKPEPEKIGPVTDAFRLDPWDPDVYDENGEPTGEQLEWPSDASVYPVADDFEGYFTDEFEEKWYRGLQPSVTDFRGEEVPEDFVGQYLAEDGLYQQRETPDIQMLSWKGVPRA